jgi:Tfp pilus assembly protein PilO
MGMRRIDRVWLAAGLALIVLVIAGGWFLLISPKFDETDAVKAETESSEIQLTKRNKEVAVLVGLEKKRNIYLAQLGVKQIALPTTYGMPAFLRQLQATGNDLDVDVSQVSVAAPISSATVPSAVEVGITLVASGSAANIGRFLTALQNGSRAVLVKSVDPDGVTGGITLSISAFCTPPTTPSTSSDTCRAS